MTDPPSDGPMDRVPQAVARDAAIVLSNLDPSLQHLRALKANASVGAQVLADSDPQSRVITRAGIGATRTVDGHAPEVRTHTLSGTVEVFFGASPAQLGRGGLQAPPAASLPCGHAVRDLALDSGPGIAWSLCKSVTPLPAGLLGNTRDSSPTSSSI